MRGWLYHRTQEPEIFEGPAYNAALADGWADSPARFGADSQVVQPAVSDDPVEVPAKNKGGRPKKVNT